MTPMRVAAQDLAVLVGTTFTPVLDAGFSQADVDAFAELTGDRQWIHVDPVRAAESGGTIVHGFLLASRIGALWGEILTVTGTAAAFNYGLDRVRFPASLRVGQPFTLTAELAAVDLRPGGALARLEVTATALGAERPALAASSLVLFTF